jgi:hypothetical protein
MSLCLLFLCQNNQKKPTELIQVDYLLLKTGLFLISTLALPPEH